MGNESKSCANCRHLSPPVVVEFANRKIEERVLCMADEWRGSVIMLSILKENPKRWRERAEKCLQYECAAMPNGSLATKKE